MERNVRARKIFEGKNTKRTKSNKMKKKNCVIRNVECIVDINNSWKLFVA